jgi:hypothetical protein
MKESDVEAYLVKRVAELGGEVRKVRWIGRRGAPDRFIFGPYWTPCFVELKRPRGGVLSAQQQDEIEKMRRGGLIVHVINAKDDIDWLLPQITPA